MVAHCPEQTYITISERCSYDCKFCSVPKFQGKIKTLDEVLALVERAKKSGTLKVISFTSGVATTPENEIDRVVEYVQAVKKYHVPIGVAVSPTTRLVATAQGCRGDGSKIQRGDHGPGHL